MIYLLGNCQMEFLGRALGDLGLACDHRALATPESALLTGGRIPDELTLWGDRLDPWLHGRSLRNQFQVVAPGDPEPSCIVLNLFHENEPLFARRDQGWLWFMDPAAWQVRPDVEAWMKERFVQARLNPDTYPNRWARLAAALRASFPRATLVLATRLGHHPGLGPAPRSYLACWDGHWKAVLDFVRDLAREIKAVVLDADRVLAKVWRKNQDVDALCPFFRVEENGNGPVPRRDVEHAAALWPALAAKLVDFLNTGEMLYGPDEAVPEAWLEPADPAPTPLSRADLSRLLASGSNYMGGRAVAAMLRTGDTDHMDLLAEHAAAMPVCHHTLHMIRHMIRHLPRNKANPHLAAWAEVQRTKIAVFTDNGPAFQQLYQERLDELAGYGISPRPHGQIKIY